MSVVPVGSATPSTSPDTATVPVGGFDVALSSQLPRADSLPSVPLDAMVSALTQGRGAMAGAREVGASIAPAGVASAGRSFSARTTVSSVDDAGAVPPGPGRAILQAGERYLGVPYLWGGTDAATGFDCSGFVQQVFADLGVRLPRVSVDQARTGAPVSSLDEARPGDLVFWHATGGRPNHIGIYAGDGQMLVAPRTGDVVRYQEITRTPDAIRRVIG